MQRTLIDQNRKAFADSVEAQKTAIESFADGVEDSKTLTERNVELSKSATHAYIDALETAVPADVADFDDLRATVDEGYEAVEQSQAEAWDAVHEAVEHSNATVEEFADTYLEAVDSSFDAFLQSHEQIEASVDSATEAVDVPVQAE